MLNVLLLPKYYTDLKSTIFHISSHHGIHIVYEYFKCKTNTALQSWTLYSVPHFSYLFTCLFDISYHSFSFCSLYFSSTKLFYFFQYPCHVCVWGFSCFLFSQTTFGSVHYLIEILTAMWLSHLDLPWIPYLMLVFTNLHLYQQHTSFSLLFHWFHAFS